LTALQQPWNVPKTKAEVNRMKKPNAFFSYLKDHPLRILALSTLLVSLFLTTLIGVYFIYVEGERRQNITSIEGQMGQLLKGRLELRVTELLSPIDVLANAQSTATMALVPFKDQSTWRANNVASHSAITDLRIIKPSDDLTMGNLQLGDISYTDLVLLKQARETLSRQLEAIKINDKWVIRYIVPISHSDNSLLMATLATDYLSAAISALPLSIPQVALIQTMGQDHPVPFVNRAGDSDSQVVLPLNGTNWLVSYTTQATLLIPEAPIQTLALILAGFGLSIVVTLIWLLYPALEGGARVIHAPSSSPQVARIKQPSALSGKSNTTKSKLTAQTLDTSAERRGKISDSSIYSDDHSTRSIYSRESSAEVEGVDGRIFRDYDIRGIAETQLPDETCIILGQAIGTILRNNDTDTLYLGYDDRKSSARIRRWVTQGLTMTGCKVIDIGAVHSGQLYFATATGETRQGVMITASHNPGEYNGLKIVIDGRARGGETIQEIKALAQSFEFASGTGSIAEDDFNERYISYIAEDIAILKPIKVVIDCANAVSARITHYMFTELGCEVYTINDEIDGSFPAHEPDPTNPENLVDLQKAVKEFDADLGFSFDGDGDRVIAVTGSGKIVEADKLLALFATDLLNRTPTSTVVYDVKCSNIVSKQVLSLGGNAIMSASGHSNIKQIMHDEDAALGGEYSGHIFFSERWFGFDDGLYAAARLLEILDLEAASLDALVSKLPESFISPEYRIKVDSDRKLGLLEEIKRAVQDIVGEHNTIDGLQIKDRTGWGLVRASNTEDLITFRFEGTDQEGLDKMVSAFKAGIEDAEVDIELPF